MVLRRSTPTSMYSSLKFVHFNEEYMLVGVDLLRTIGNNIQIDGVRGKQWDFTRDEKGKPIGIWLLLDLNRRRISPGGIVTITGHNGDYRSEIDRISERAPESFEEMHWFDETRAPVVLDGVNAVLY